MNMNATEWTADMKKSPTEPPVRTISHTHLAPMYPSSGAAASLRDGCDTPRSSTIRKRRGERGRAQFHCGI
eukprot:1904929-Prymnesium_polylepis.1